MTEKMMNKYELMVIVNSQLPQEEKESIFKHATDCVVKGGAKVINGQVWQDKLKMNFPIKRCQEATYYLINFEGGGASVSGIRDLLRLNENMLRFSIFNVTI